MKIVILDAVIPTKMTTFSFLKKQKIYFEKHYRIFKIQQ